jgi:hypothetical protein
LTQDDGTLGHEVHTTEHGELGFGLGRRQLRQLVRVALVIGKLNHFVALVVVAENGEARAKLRAKFPDAGIAFSGIHLEVGTIDAFLSHRPYAIGSELLVGTGSFFGNARCRGQLRIFEPDDRSFQRRG